MANNPNSRRVGAVNVRNGNKLQRGDAVAATVAEAKSSTLAQVTSDSGGGGGGGGGGSGTVTSITAGTGIALTPNPIVTAGTVALAASFTAAGPLGTSTRVPVVTRDVYGRVTALTDVAIAFPSPGIGLPTTGPLYGRLRKKISGTITSTADVDWAAAEEFYVQDYGALCDGSTDDITAVNAAVAALIAAGGGSLNFPPGTCKMSTALTLTKSANNQSVRVRGHGCGVTKLYFPNATDGLAIIDTVNQTEGATTSNSNTVEDLSICTGRVGGGLGLNLIGKNTNGTESGTIVRRVTIEGYTNGKYWGGAMYFKDLPNLAVTDVRAVSGANTGNAITLESNSGQTIADFNRVRIQGFDVGLLSIGSNAYEGVTLHACTFVLVNTGIYWNTTTGEEQLNVVDCHIAANSAWMVINNCERVFVTNGNFQKVGSGTFVGIDINANCNWAKITSTFMRCESGDVAVSLDSGFHTVSCNTMQGPATGIVLNAGCVNSLAIGNQNYNAAGTMRAGTCVTDLGTGNQLVSNF